MLIIGMCEGIMIGWKAIIKIRNVDSVKRTAVTSSDYFWSPGTQVFCSMLERYGWNELMFGCSV